MHNTSGILGSWDLSVLPRRLGDLLFFIEELNIQRYLYKVARADVCILSDDAKDWVREITKKECRDIYPISIFFDMEGIGKCYICKSIKGIEEFLKGKSYRVWPRLNYRTKVKYRYDTTQYIQSFYRKHHFVPYLSCKKSLILWALDFIANNVTPCLPVVVHLKNSPGTESNADFDAWFPFFRESLKKKDVRFILIGNEEIDERISKLKNIIIARNYGSNMACDLALIQTSCFFMGMVSGPGNMAIFNPMPYILYKDPDHSTEKMFAEMGVSDRFPFAAPLQNLLRIRHDTKNLRKEFNRRMRPEIVEAWRDRIDELSKETRFLRN